MAPTPLDRMLHSKNAFLAFSGIITAVAAWAILKPDPMFPLVGDPHGGFTDGSFGDYIDPGEWTLGELRQWLRMRGLEPSDTATRAELAERVKLNIRQPRQGAES